MSDPEAWRWRVPLAEVSLGPEEVEAVCRVVRSGWLSMGPRVQEFEQRFAAFLGSRHALAVASGTAALHLACLALGLKAGDEVLCPSLTFVASVNAILYTGARPVFVDIAGPHDLNLSVADAARKLSPRTRAILAVHYGGYACDLEAVRALAAGHGLKVIEDCAHAPGALYPTPAGPRRVGTGGSAGCFSFFANKNLTTGEGGMVVTDDDELAERLRLLRSHGMTTLTWDRHRGHSFSYDVVTPGFNYRLDEMRAALGLVQLARLEEANARRRQHTRRYREKLRELPPVQLSFLDADLTASACHLFPILLPAGENRLAFLEFLRERGIQSSIHYPPVHTFSAYRRLWPPGHDHRLPQTEAVAAREVTLPLFPGLTASQLELVTGAVQEYFARARGS